MAWLPAARGAVVSVAAPPAPTLPAPRTTDPSRNVTVPVGAPTPGATALTIAVKVIGWLALAGVADGGRVVAVAAMETKPVSGAQVGGEENVLAAQDGAAKG